MQGVIDNNDTCNRDISPPSPTGGGGGRDFTLPPDYQFKWVCDWEWIDFETTSDGIWYDANGILTVGVSAKKSIISWECSFEQSSSVVSGSDPCNPQDEIAVIDPSCPDGYVKNKFGECVKDCSTTKQELAKVFTITSNEKLEEIANTINKYAKDFDIDTDAELQHFLAQAAHESQKYNGEHFEAFEENLNYKITKLGTSEFESYFNPSSNPYADPSKANPNDFKRADKPEYAKPEKLANYVYYDAKRRKTSQLGNTEYGDGYKYRGRGIMQLTGKYNYDRFNNYYKKNYDDSVDLLSNPDLLSTDLKLGVLSGLWHFKTNVMGKKAITSETSVKEVSRLVNGGKNGLQDRINLFNKVKQLITCL